MISALTTPADLREADPQTAQALRDGLEIRTACCIRVVPEPCNQGECDHPRPDPRDPQDRPLCNEYFENIAVFHAECPNPRSINMALSEASCQQQEETERNNG